jgi:cupin 2 domain-containing protein
MEIKNLFTRHAAASGEEMSETLLRTDCLRLERILSTGQSTPPGQWYDQEADEWVVLLSGSAALLFEGKDEVRVLRPGDYLLIPAHTRHRVEWTETGRETVWLAAHVATERAKRER